ncbi:MULTISPECIES: bacillithiol biosynthesis cysteine-adding enzyme BshC [unclassified Paenibacillus]|uniref:bacillithiol biosynthesis cysteine-adding enzyme BshC n=1 Tax=unclassified Paenibacillus TaxID=185978 RepID=UPI001C110912|nr:MULTISPECIES: bacillithiol biosynthesis cysteine-adding enzyme BshC [unclassified Paenibacillus]MBU5440507.1 bacillithiol biosynthesis cysteine-adding enzyme BshC [Paenibacillus sp. MSJ-34]CAH0119570.1 Putative cysteine ligase BshC [Paenibacillus sp. CECT 9249]
MKVVNGPVAASNPLAEHVMRRFQEVRELFEFDPQTDWEARASWIDGSADTRVDRKQLAACLRSYNAGRNDADAVREALEALEREETLAVVGGQQSGLFTGPLLVVYKAATIIQTARMAERKLGRKVVPVFWIAGEDHDFDEVNHTYVLSPELKAERIKLDRPTEERTSISRIAFQAEQWDAAIEQLASLLPDSEWKPALLARLKRFASESATLSDYFARMIGWLFGQYGLVLLDSADPGLRRVEAGMFERLIADNDELERALFASEEEVRRLGFAPQADVVEGNANLFILHEGMRLLLHKEGERFTDRKGLVSYTASQLREEARLHPERFSNNVFTRPLMQDHLLPVLAAVLGPGEIAYWALTRRAFRTFRMRMPIIVPRMAFTLLDGTLEKHMDKFGLRFADIGDKFAERRDAWLKGQDSLELDEQFAALKTEVERMYAPLLGKLTLIQPGLGKLGETNRQRVLDQIAYLEQRAFEAIAKQNDAELKQWERIQMSLLPLGKPQERVYNIFAYLNRYGETLISDIMEIPLDISGQHRLIYL